MSSKAKTVASPSPLTFKAGGKKKGLDSQPKKVEESKKSTRSASTEFHQPSFNSPRKQPSPHSSSDVVSVLQTGLAAKRSPLQIKNWIACVLTLDGRDKFTKVLQYSSRLLCWYFAGLARKTAFGVGDGAGVGSAAGSAGSILAALSANIELRQQYYSAISKRFDALYKSLVTSRKAFRLGRSIIEWDKISSMGWGDYLKYMLLHPLAGGAADAGADTEDVTEKNRGESLLTSNTLARYDTHPIQEEDEEDHSSHAEDDGSSWDGDEQSLTDEDENGLPTEEKKIDTTFTASSTKVKVISRPGRPKLPSRISSNVGWGPSTTTTTSESATSGTRAQKHQSSSKSPVPRTVSEMGRQMYQAFPSRSSSMGSYKQVKEQTPNEIQMQPIKLPEPTPSWKLIGGTMKLLGLMGFWAFDNLSFLTGSGFLDPMHGANGVIIDPKASDRMKRKKRCSELAGQCYFMGVLAGLYVNARALWEHRNGLLKQAQGRLDEAVLMSTNPTDDDGSIGDAKDNLQQTKQKHFVLALALLKSCCDFMVFSNNPGIDLHLKYRGKRNHEGLHCLGGLISASTVLYNNFPNAK